MSLTKRVSSLSGRLSNVSRASMQTMNTVIEDAPLPYFYLVYQNKASTNIEKILNSDVSMTTFYWHLEKLLKLAKKYSSVSEVPIDEKKGQNQTHRDELGQDVDNVFVGDKERNQLESNAGDMALADLETRRIYKINLKSNSNSKRLINEIKTKKIYHLIKISIKEVLKEVISSSQKHKNRAGAVSPSVSLMSSLDGIDRIYLANGSSSKDSKKKRERERKEIKYQPELSATAAAEQARRNRKLALAGGFQNSKEVGERTLIGDDHDLRESSTAQNQNILKNSTLPKNEKSRSKSPLSGDNNRLQSSGGFASIKSSKNGMELIKVYQVDLVPYFMPSVEQNKVLKIMKKNLEAELLMLNSE